MTSWLKLFIRIITNNYEDDINHYNYTLKKLTHTNNNYYNDGYYKGKYTHHNYLDLLTDDTYYKPTLITNTKYDKYYVDKVGNDLSVRQYLLLVVPHLPTLINEHKNELVNVVFN